MHSRTLAALALSHAPLLSRRFHSWSNAAWAAGVLALATSSFGTSRAMRLNSSSLELSSLILSLILSRKAFLWGSASGSGSALVGMHGAAFGHGRRKTFPFTFQTCLFVLPASGCPEHGCCCGLFVRSPPDEGSEAFAFFSPSISLSTFFLWEGPSSLQGSDGKSFGLAEPLTILKPSKRYPSGAGASLGSTSRSAAGNSTGAPLTSSASAASGRAGAILREYISPSCKSGKTKGSWGMMLSCNRSVLGSDSSALILNGKIKPSEGTSSRFVLWTVTLPFSRW